MSSPICINVGGVFFWTSAQTLSRENTFFSGLVHTLESHSETDLYVSTPLIDRDPTHFRVVLNWLRGVRCLPEDFGTLEELFYEVDFYCIESMKIAIQRKNANVYPSVQRNRNDSP